MSGSRRLPCLHDRYYCHHRHRRRHMRRASRSSRAWRQTLRIRARAENVSERNEEVRSSSCETHYPMVSFFISTNQVRVPRVARKNGRTDDGPSSRAGERALDCVECSSQDPNGRSTIESAGREGQDGDRAAAAGLSQGLRRGGNELEMRITRDDTRRTSERLTCVRPCGFECGAAEDRVGVGAGIVELHDAGLPRAERIVVGDGREDRFVSRQ